MLQKENYASTTNHNKVDVVTVVSFITPLSLSFKRARNAANLSDSVDSIHCISCSGESHRSGDNECSAYKDMKKIVRMAYVEDITFD